jgi:hypothetical protein
MNREDGTIVTRSWMALAALSLATSLAAQQPAPAAPAAPRPARAPRAAVAPTPAPAAVASTPAVPAVAFAPTGWLGIGISCSHCSLYRQGGQDPEWIFREAPTVMWLDSPDSPGYRAGLRNGDTLTAIDGVSLTSQEGGRAFARVRPGQTVRLTYRRDGSERQADVTAVERPGNQAYAEAMRRYSQVQDTQMQRAYEQMRRAQEDMRRVQEQLREQQRTQLDSSRRQLMAAESTLRALQRAQAQAFADRNRNRSDNGNGEWLGVRPAKPVRGWASAGTGVSGTGPLRYSGRLGDLVNVEARAPGPVNVSETGDSLIVVTAGDVVVTIRRRTATVTPRPRSR